jgi:hypothetical protein
MVSSSVVKNGVPARFHERGGQDPRATSVQRNGNDPEITSCDGRWQPGSPVNGIDGYVLAIAADGQGNVYAGGNFTVAGSSFVNNIAKLGRNQMASFGVRIKRPSKRDRNIR